MESHDQKLYSYWLSAKSMDTPGHCLPFNDSQHVTIKAPNQQLADLWDKAVKEYTQEARLNRAEQDELQKWHSPNEIFDAAKIKWDKNVIDR